MELVKKVLQGDEESAACRVLLQLQGSWHEPLNKFEIQIL